MFIKTHECPPVPAPELTGMPALVGRDPKYKWIKWAEVTLSVHADFVDEPTKPRHAITVHNADGKGRDFVFGTVGHGDDGYRIVTGPLSAEQTAVFRELVGRSVAACTSHPADL